MSQLQGPNQGNVTPEGASVSCDSVDLGRARSYPERADVMRRQVGESMTDETRSDLRGLSVGSAGLAAEAIPADCISVAPTQATPTIDGTGDGVSKPQKRVQRIFTCGGCSARWTLLRRAHCSGCHVTFTGVTAFDQHRVHGGCATPPTVGLVEREPGLWGAPPMPAEVAERLRAAGVR